jgi:hypothetical protein
MSVSVVGKVAVWKAGYEWVKVNRRRDLVAMPIGFPIPAESHDRYWWNRDTERCRYYDPFREPALFRIFADLDGSQGAILAFCNQFGGLHSYLDPGVGLKECRRAIDNMRQAITIWDAIQSGDADAIATCCEPFTKDPDTIGAMAYMASQQEELAAMEHHLSTPAERFLARIVQDKFRHADLRGIHFLPRPGGLMELVLPIQCLWDAMWLQLALSIVERKEYRRCEHCGRPFLLSPEENRADRRYHNNSCRVKAYRLRKAKAIKMRAGGAAIRTIVKELDSDIETVKKWLGEKK